MMMRGRVGRERLAIPTLGIEAARRVRRDLEYAHPTELEIETLAFLRHALVRSTPTTGARANLLRIGARGIISVADRLPLDQRRWAIAHDLGHFEAHANVNFIGLCVGEDMRFEYDKSGREQEANAFAAELLMPEDLFEPLCDVPKVSWTVIGKLAEAFQVSLTAAGVRFLAFTYERLALIVSKHGKIAWSQSTRDFGRRLSKGSALDQSSLAYDFFKSGQVSRIPETVDASAWIPDPGDVEEVIEHAFPIPRLNMVLSLVWFPAT